MTDEELLEAIRERDAECGDDLPEHWKAQLDRRVLLRLLDGALNANANRG